MKKLARHIFMFFCLVAFAWCFMGMQSEAAVKNIVITPQNKTQQFSGTIGDTGKISLSSEWADQYGESVRIIFSPGWNEVIDVDEDGNYKIVGPGKEWISYEIRAMQQPEEGEASDEDTFENEEYESEYDAMEEKCVEWGSLCFEGNYDLSRWKISTSQMCYKEKNAWMSKQITIPLFSGIPNFDVYEAEDADVYSVSISPSDGNVSCYQTAQGMAFQYWGTQNKDYKISVKIHNVTKTVTIKCRVVSLSLGDCYYLTKGKSKTAKVKGYSGKITWKSYNKKVATVSSKGKIKGKKEGNVVICATLPDGTKMASVVCVVSASRAKIVKRAIYIGKNWKYSQPKRMKKGYYDCSSLVWKAYKEGKRTLISKNYAPVAADLGKWCVKKKKVPKGNLYTNVAKMKYKPGALLFKTGKKNGRYRGIYHVEMLVGYVVTGFDAKGNPTVLPKWASRNSYYSYSGFMGQP